MKSKRLFMSGLTTLMVCTLFSSLNAATSSSSTTSKKSSTSTFRSDQDEEDRKGAVKDFVMAVIGGMLRHPDPTIRKQAIQTIASGMVGNDNTSNNSSETGGIKSLFAINSKDSNDKDNVSTGVGGAVFIPDMYILLAAPDPEVRDIASVGLDMIFQKDTT